LRYCAAYSLMLALGTSGGANAETISIDEHLTNALRAYDGGHLETAWESWQLAAHAGSTDAMTSLASMLERGEGLRPDARRAATWYRRAARLGDPIGQLNLGEMYLLGRGLKKDRGEAIFWLTLAGRGGNAWAAAKSLEAAQGLSSTTVSTIQSRLRAWKPIAASIR